MKKRFLHLILTAAAVLSCTFGAAVSVSAARPLEDTIPDCKLYDVDNFLSADEQMQIDQLISDVSREIDMYVAVCILNESGDGMADYDCEDYADNLYDKLFNVPYGKETDGEILLLNMPMHAITIENSGMGEFYYYSDPGSSIDRNDTMRENIISYMRESDYVGAVEQFCDDLKHYKKQGLPKDAQTYNPQTGQYAYVHKGQIEFANKLPWWYGFKFGLWSAISAAVGGLTGLISMLIVKSNYKFTKSLDPTNYVSQKDTKYLVKDDVFIRTHTTKHRIDSDGGGRSGGGGGGGISHTSSGGFSHSGGTSHW